MKLSKVPHPQGGGCSGGEQLVPAAAGGKSCWKKANKRLAEPWVSRSQSLHDP